MVSIAKHLSSRSEFPENEWVCVCVWKEGVIKKEVDIEPTYIKIYNHKGSENKNKNCIFLSNTVN